MAKLSKHWKFKWVGNEGGIASLSYVAPAPAPSQPMYVTEGF